MGKEIRVGLSVVGVLLLLFCGLLYARIMGSGLALPEVSLSATPRLITEPPRVRVQPTIVQQSGSWDELTTPLHAEPLPAVNSPANVQQAEITARRAANPHRVGEVELTSAEGIAEDLSNPRAASIAVSSSSERVSAAAGNLPAQLDVRPLPAADISPDDAAEPIRLAVGERDTLRQLAIRAYGDAQYESALAQLLRDTGVTQLRAGALLELPAPEELRARYPRLVPSW